MSSLSYQLDMALMRERLSIMEALLLQHKIKVPKPIKNCESSLQASVRINQRKLFAARALERLNTDGIEVSFSIARPTSDPSDLTRSRDARRRPRLLNTLYVICHTVWTKSACALRTQKTSRVHVSKHSRS